MRARHAGGHIGTRRRNRDTDTICDLMLGEHAALMACDFDAANVARAKLRALAPVEFGDVTDITEQERSLYTRISSLMAAKH